MFARLGLWTGNEKSYSAPVTISIEPVNQPFKMSTYFVFVAGVVFDNKPNKPNKFEFVCKSRVVIFPALRATCTAVQTDFNFRF